MEFFLQVRSSFLKNIFRIFKHFVELLKKMCIGCIYTQVLKVPLPKNATIYLPNWFLFSFANTGRVCTFLLRKKSQRPYISDFGRGAAAATACLLQHDGGEGGLWAHGPGMLLVLRSVGYRR